VEDDQRGEGELLWRLGILCGNHTSPMMISTPHAHKQVNITYIFVSGMPWLFLFELFYLCICICEALHINTEAISNKYLGLPTIVGAHRSDIFEKY
jgi:hypothetical protein